MTERQTATPPRPTRSRTPAAASRRWRRRRSTRRSASSTTRTTARRRRRTSRRRRSPPPRAARQQDRPAVRHAGERRQLHLDQRRRRRPLRDREPRRQLRRRGVGSDPASRRDPTQALLPREARRLHAAGPARAPTTARAAPRTGSRSLGDMVAIAFYGQGTRDPRRVRPDRHQAGRLLPRSRPTATGGNPAQLANNASAAYWHNGYIYVADYTRGIDVLRYTDPIKGVVQPKVCWNSCDDSQTPAKTPTTTPGGAGGTGPGHAGADAGHAGRRSARSRRASPRTTRRPRRPTSSRPRVTRAERRRPVLERDRPPGQRRVLAAVGAAGQGRQPGRRRRALAAVGGSARADLRC